MQTSLIDIQSEFRSYHPGTILKNYPLGHKNSGPLEKQLNERKASFASIVSHEFNTPLSCILSSASLIAMYKGADQQNEREKHVQRIAVSVQDLNNIINEFLPIMQLKNEAINTDFILFNLPDYFNEIIDQLHGLVSIKQQCIEYKHEGKKMVGLSKKILKHILLNLLSNASKYSMEGSVINLYSSATEREVKITVKDKGIGIPEADQQKMFTRFFRASNVKDIQGTGLGLTIVKKHVELLNGTINFCSKSNEGTVFEIIIPQFFQT